MHLKRAIQKSTQVNGDLIGNKIYNEITKAFRNSPRNNSKTVESKIEIPRKRYMSPEKRNGIIDDLRLI